MYLRFIRLVVREGAEAEFQAFYRSRVIPTLNALPGCLFAGLLTPWRSEEHRSLTLWRSAEDAREYEEGGLYQMLLKESMPYLSSRTVWRARLTEEEREADGSATNQGAFLNLDALETLAPTSGPSPAPAVQEIPPEGYELLGDEAPEKLARLSRSVYVRVVAVKVAPDRRAKFETLYRDAVLPAVQEQAGCLGAFLAEGVRDPNEALSITVWDREESATRYEMSGEFERLTRQVEETLSPLSQWQLALGEGGVERRRSPGVATYHLVHGRKLARGDEPG